MLDQNKIFEKKGVTQRIMALLVGCSPAKVNRYVKSNNIKCLDLGRPKKLKFSIKDTRRIVSGLLPLKKVKKKSHCFYNFKGGTGKTSITFQVSSHLALMGYKVLVVDADPQAHLSAALGFYDDIDDGLTLYDVIVGGLSIDDVIRPVYEGFDCITSNLSLTRVELPLTQFTKREEIIKFVFEPLKERYDFIIFDTNPTISHLNRNIVVASDKINIVSETQPFSINGLKILMEDLKSFFHDMRAEIPDIVIIPNKYEGKMSTAQEAMGLLHKVYTRHLIRDFVLRKSEDFNISAKTSLPFAFFCKTNSNAMFDIFEFLHHFLSESQAFYKENL